MFNVYIGELLVMRVYEDDTIEYVAPPEPPEPPTPVSDIDYSSTVIIVQIPITEVSSTYDYSTITQYSSEVI